MFETRESGGSEVRGGSEELEEEERLERGEKEPWDVKEGEGEIAGRSGARRRTNAAAVDHPDGDGRSHGGRGRTAVGDHKIMNDVVEHVGVFLDMKCFVNF